MNPNPSSSILLYGKGVFTTVAIRDRKLFLWAKHWRRLQNNAAKLGIDISEHSETEVRSELDQLIREEDLDQGRSRITFAEVSPSRMWGGSGERRTELLINTGPKRLLPDHLKLTLSPHLVNSTSPLAGVKSCNYLDQLMAYDEARGRGFDEAIRLNEKGDVTSACMANVFWETGGKLFTPSLSTGCLAGTTREFVIENFDCGEAEKGIETLESAERIFLTSAGHGIAPVAELNGRRLDTSEHEILNLLPV